AMRPKVSEPLPTRPTKGSGPPAEPATGHLNYSQARTLMMASQALPSATIYYLAPLPLLVAPLLAPLAGQSPWWGEWVMVLKPLAASPSPPVTGKAKLP